MITVQFGIQVRKDSWSKPYIKTVTVDTECESLEEAFKVAIAQGHDPFKNLRWWDRDERKRANV